MDIRSEEKVLENLRKQLGVAVRSVEWSYAIFWSLSTTQQGVLEWGEGYYNGDIMIRKTVPESEAYASKVGLQRSQQLRELYESLLEGESELGSKTPSATLSLEDLSNLEWYYLVCMSFVFKVGQSLPGRAFANGQSIWLCNVQDADSRLFSRSLLAKSASVKTVFCFPHWEGVIELGVTDLVSEDLNLIQHIKTSLLEFAKPICYVKSFDQQNADFHKDWVGAKIHVMNQEMLELEAFTKLYPTEEIRFQEEMSNELHRSVTKEFNNMDSSDDSSDDCCGNNHQTDCPFMQGGGCVSQDFSAQEKTMLDKYADKQLHFEDLQDYSHTRFCSLEVGNNDDDLHYKRTLAVVLQSVRSKFLYICGHKSSSFVPWKKEFAMNCFIPESSQRTLKKLLLMVPLMIAKNTLEPQKKDGKEDNPTKPIANNRYEHQGLSDKGRENENYQIDKTSSLNGTIEYLKKRKARVEELESSVNLSDSEAKARRKFVDVVEQTSDNYHNKSRDDGNKKWLSKRKACDIGENEAELELHKVNSSVNNMTQDVKVTIREQEVLIDIRCPWRDYLLLDIIDSINNLSLDAHTVQSSTIDGILSATLKSKFRGAAFASAGTIKQTLRRTLGIR